MNSKVAAYQQSVDMNAIVERHAPLVKRIAHHLMARLPASVIVDDLIQSGMIGLLEAAKNFDGSKGASFETFAGIRIRGAMLDEIRKGDWTPRSVHKNSRTITEAIAQVERETGGDARDVDIAAKLNVPLAQYHQMLNEVNAGKLVAIEDLGVSEDVIGDEQSKGSDVPFEDLMQGAPKGHEHGKESGLEVARFHCVPAPPLQHEHIAFATLRRSRMLWARIGGAHSPIAWGLGA